LRELIARCTSPLIAPRNELVSAALAYSNGLLATEILDSE
jgi:hypothetical protein